MTVLVTVRVTIRVTGEREERGEGGQEARGDEEVCLSLLQPAHQVRGQYEHSQPGTQADPGTA